MENIGFDNEQSTPVRNNNNNKKIICACVIVAVVIFVIIVAVTVALTTSETKKSIDVINASMSVEYIEGLGYTATISGMAKNNTRENLSYAQIEFSVYDSVGNNIGTALANINNLGDGDTWSFRATLLSFPSTQPVNFKFADATYF